jgi:hypothetical protein
MSEKPAPNPQPQGQFWLRQPDSSLTGERPDVPSPFQALQKPGDVLPDEHKPEGMRELFRRRIVVPALRGAIAVLKSTCWKPGDPITRFSTSWEELIGEPDADTEEYDETTHIDVSGGTMTPFTPKQEAEFLAWLDEHKEELRRKAFEGSDED